MAGVAVAKLPNRFRYAFGLLAAISLAVYRSPLLPHLRIGENSRRVLRVLVVLRGPIGRCAVV
jgi:hypothetical protein